MRKSVDQYRQILVAAVISIVVLIPSAIAATGQPRPLSGDAIKGIVLSSTVHLHTPLGTTVPIIHRKDGSVTGKAGAVSWFLGASTDKGRWWVAKNKLCHHWKIWFKGKPNCMQIRRRGTKFSWRQDDGETGIVSIVPLRKRTRHARKTIKDPVGLAGPLPSARQKPAQQKTQPIPKKPKALRTSPRKQKIARATIAPLSSRAIPPVPAAKPASPAAKRISSQKQNRVRFRVVGVPADDVLNIRREPTAFAPIIGTLDPRTRGVRKTGKCSDGWCPVRYSNKSGWVNRTFLARENRAPTRRFRVVNVQSGDVLYVRMGARQTAPVIATIPPHGKGVKITGPCDKDWCPIKHVRNTGWVNRNFLAPEVQSTANTN